MGRITPNNRVTQAKLNRILQVTNNIMEGEVEGISKRHLVEAVKYWARCAGERDSQILAMRTTILLQAMEFQKDYR